MSDCQHESRRVAKIISTCESCGRYFIDTVSAECGRLITKVRQGVIDKETALLDSDLTDEQRTMIQSLPVCEHKGEIEEYDCSCSKGRRWRCKVCGLTSDYPERFKRGK